MAIITRAYSETDGAIAEASSVNKVIDDLYTLQAGNITTGNIDASGVAAANLGNSSVAARTVADDTIAQIVYHNEVFG